MNFNSLLKKLLPGFIPIIVFIAADEIWGTQVGLIVAIVFGVAAMLYYWIKEKRFDKFIFFDTLLIVALGGISIVLNNDVFFKIKPAIISTILCLVLAVSAFSSKNIVFGMSKHYLGDVQISQEQERQMQKSIKGLFYVFTIYTLLSYYSVWFMSKKAWAFVNGGFLYVVFAMFFVFQLGKKWYLKRKENNEEWLPLVNEKGDVIGKAPRSACHADKSLMHPVVHLHVLNKRGDIYLQKRPKNKLIQPGKWDTAVGGHIAFGEKLEESLFREAQEEIGVQFFKPQLYTKYVWKSDVETEYVFTFVTQYNDPIVIPNDEVEEGRFWSKKEIRQNMGRDVFTPNFEHEFKLIQKLIK